jgi:hypothetical protein
MRWIYAGVFICFAVNRFLEALYSVQKIITRSLCGYQTNTFVFVDNMCISG